MIEITSEEFIMKTEHEPLKNIALLRHAKLFHHHARYYSMDDNSDEVVLFEKSLSRSDIDDYPSAQTVAICRTGTCFEELKAVLRGGKHIIKINGRILRRDLRETNRFISLTCIKSCSLDLTKTPRLIEVSTPSDRHYNLVSLAHWSATDIDSALLNGARMFCIEQEEYPVVACILHNAYGDIWEIGALGTDPLMQNKGMAKTLVKLVTNAILLENKIPRYHVNSKNERSLRVAMACGYQQFMEFVHYEFEI